MTDAVAAYNSREVNGRSPLGFQLTLDEKGDMISQHGVESDVERMVTDWHRWIFKLIAIVTRHQKQRMDKPSSRRTMAVKSSKTNGIQTRRGTMSAKTPSFS